MKTLDFEKQIQKDIDSELSIRINPNHDDIAGVYWKEVYLGISVPPQEIKEQYDSSYRDEKENPYRDMITALELIKGKTAKFKRVFEEDPDLFKPVTNEKELPIKHVTE